MRFPVPATTPEIYIIHPEQAIQILQLEYSCRHKLYSFEGFFTALTGSDEFAHVSYTCEPEVTTVSEFAHVSANCLTCEPEVTTMSELAHVSTDCVLYLWTGSDDSVWACPRVS